MITPELAELRAVESMPGAAADYREVLRLLENMGFKEFQYYRKKKGKTIKKQFKLCNLTH